MLAASRMDLAEIIEPTLCDYCHTSPGNVSVHVYSVNF